MKFLEFLFVMLQSVYFFFPVILFPHYWPEVGGKFDENTMYYKFKKLSLNTRWPETRQPSDISGIMKKPYTENSNNKNIMFCLPEHYIKILYDSWLNIKYLCADMTALNILISNPNVSSYHNLLTIKCTDKWTTHGSKIHFWQERPSYLICKLNK